MDDDGNDGAPSEQPPRIDVMHADQTAADADQTAADDDQTAADADQTAADADQRASLSDQDSANADQASADVDEAHSVGQSKTYQQTRDARARTSIERHATEMDRGRAAGDRTRTAGTRDDVAARRDERAEARDARAAALERSIGRFDAEAARRLEALREQAAADRAAAARDRALAAADREKAAAARAELEVQLQSTHLDDLTGAYRREIGRIAISHEIDRARRNGVQFVLAFIDLDGLKGINDRDGHAAGDHALRTMVGAFRTRLRSFDPIYRYGGDEFVAGLGGTDLAGAERRIESIRVWLDRTAGVRFSVGFATMAAGDTVDEMTARADNDLYRRRSEAGRAPTQGRPASPDPRTAKRPANRPARSSESRPAAKRPSPAGARRPRAAPG